MCRILILLFLPCFVYSQKKPIGDDSLAKYSYLVVGTKYKDGQSWVRPVGTGFFFRDNNRLFFITAKHVITGVSTTSNTPIGVQDDSLWVRYFCKSDKKAKYIYLNTKLIKNELLNRNSYQDPDMCIVNAGIAPGDGEFFTLENIISSFQIFDETPKKIIAYGYADIPALSNMQSYYTTKLDGYLADAFHINHQAAASNDSLNYLAQPMVAGGMSGSPVFYKYSKSGKEPKEWVSFGGLLFGTDSIYRTTHIVRPMVVIGEILKFFSE